MEQDAWEVVRASSEEENQSAEESESPKTIGEEIEGMMEILQNAINDVFRGKFDYSKADRMAALALGLSMEVVKVFADAEWRTRQMKAEIKYLSAEANYKYRTESDKKLSEAALEQLVNKDENVRQAEFKMAEFEKQSKQWQGQLANLRDAHVYFRNLGKL